MTQLRKDAGGGLPVESLGKSDINIGATTTAQTQKTEKSRNEQKRKEGAKKI